jgi:hypothetical protein
MEVAYPTILQRNLVLAVNTGYLEVVNYLLDTEQLAIERGNVEIVQAFLDHGSDPTQSNNEPLYLAIRNNRLESVKLLFERGLTIERQPGPFILRNRAYFIGIAAHDADESIS